MIKSISVTNYLGEAIVMPLMEPEKSGFAVIRIEGLGAGKADINTTELAENDGSLYNSARMSQRNIVITLRFMFDKTIEDARQRTYKYFPLKKPLNLLIETDNRLAEITGYVEANEPDIFSKEEETKISIICPNPYFYSAGPRGTTVTVFAGVESAFEFPFSNESLTEPLIIFGNIQKHTEGTILYKGDSEIGITIYINALGPATFPAIYNITTREQMIINTDKLLTLTGSGIVAGDEIIICTVKGEKSIMLLRAGIYINILNTLARDTDWFQIAKGDNLFAFAATSGLQNLQFRIENKTIYEGI